MTGWKPIETAPKDGTPFMAEWSAPDNRGLPCLMVTFWAEPTGPLRTLPPHDEAKAAPVTWQPLHGRTLVGARVWRDETIQLGTPVYEPVMYWSDGGCSRFEAVVRGTPLNASPGWIGVNIDVLPPEFVFVPLSQWTPPDE